MAGEQLAAVLAAAAARVEVLIPQDSALLVPKTARRILVSELA